MKLNYLNWKLGSLSIHFTFGKMKQHKFICNNYVIDNSYQISILIQGNLSCENNALNEQKKSWNIKKGKLKWLKTVLNQNVLNKYECQDLLFSFLTVCLLISSEFV